MPIPKRLEGIVTKMGANIYKFEPSHVVYGLEEAARAALLYAKECDHDILLVYNEHYITVSKTAIDRQAAVQDIMQRYYDRDHPQPTRGEGHGQTT